jgi:hypothetical protein
MRLARFFDVARFQLLLGLCGHCTSAMIHHEASIRLVLTS